jgi:predicted kinase
MTKIVFVTGAPASGKTTIARLVAEYFPKSLHLQVDQLREMMVRGVELPDHGWTDEATRQFQWARSTAGYMAQLYADQGVTVVIDDVCVPPEFADQYAVLFDNPATQRVLLLPTLEALVERLHKRAGPFDQFLIEQVPWLYSYLLPMSKAGWIVLDSSDWTVDQTVNELLNRI